MIETPGHWCQDSWGEGESRHEMPCGGIARAWALDLVRTGPSLSLATWLGNVNFLVGKMTLTKDKKDNGEGEGGGGGENI